MSEIIKKNSIFKIEYNEAHSGDKMILHCKAVIDLHKVELRKDMIEFSKSEINSKKFCAKEECEGHNVDFEPNYLYCPFCRQMMQLEFKKPTIKQFITAHSNLLVIVHLETFYADLCLFV